MRSIATLTIFTAKRRCSSTTMVTALFFGRALTATVLETSKSGRTSSSKEFVEAFRAQRTRAAPNSREVP